MSMKPAINAGAGLAAGAGAAAAQGAQMILQADEARVKRLNSIFDGIYRYQDRRDANLKFQKEMAIKDKDLALKQGQLDYQQTVLKHEKDKHNKLWTVSEENAKKGIQPLAVQEIKARINATSNLGYLHATQGQGQNILNLFNKNEFDTALKMQNHDEQDNYFLRR